MYINCPWLVLVLGGIYLCAAERFSLQDILSLLLATGAQRFPPVSNPPPLSLTSSLHGGCTAKEQGRAGSLLLTGSLH